MLTVVMDNVAKECITKKNIFGLFFPLGEEKVEGS
jgi:hypothetical protein